MAIYGELTGFCWLVLFGFWVVMAFRAKKSIRTRSLWTGVSMRIVLFVVVILLLRSPEGRHWLERPGSGLFVAGTLVRDIGVLLCALGVALAIWARIYLASNWGMPMSLKENPELVTGGPYAVIRHPIYTGILAAVLGSALADSGLWLIPFAIFVAYFVFSAAREEKNMLRLFPGAYADYRGRTRMLIPFVF